MSEAILEDLRMDTLGDEHGGVAVAEVVEAEGFTHRSSESGKPFAPAEVGAAHGTSVGRRKDPAVRVPMTSEVFGELLHQEGWHGDGAT